MTTHVLILCTHNSARSVLAEAMFNRWALLLKIDAQAHSAGAAPSGRVHPQALAVLSAAGVDVSQLASKNMNVFAQAGAPEMRVVITVCDSAATQPCPVWPGAPVRAHWSYPDPSAAPAPEQPERFELTRQAIAYRMLQLVQLPFGELDNQALQPLVQRIGES
ncbi:arsenate reductase ArsC [Comamonas testosteroni]|uniref:Arsenate reductase ArsC n=1 Tax=Comamonas testosteroni TaxID=285 RepID=A0A373F6U7_COMTE|nr:arsenate reductase ArsC [Comamonas testosteroni]RGE39858.1 arsenate reductase ArsC [Comamonas testosteroni]